MARREEFDSAALADMYDDLEIPAKDVLPGDYLQWDKGPNAGDAKSPRTGMQSTRIRENFYEAPSRDYPVAEQKLVFDREGDFGGTFPAQPDQMVKIRRPRA